MSIKINDNIVIADNNTFITPALTQTKVAMAANNIDLSLGTVFTKSISATTVFTVSNVPASGTVASFVLELTPTVASLGIGWFSGVRWQGGTAPILPYSTTTFAFYTHDGGSTWISGILLKDPPQIEQLYTSPGTYSWTCPTGVTSVSVVCVGGGGGGAGAADIFTNGGGGAGGGLSYKNSIVVTPGNTYTVVVGAGGAGGPAGTGSTASSGVAGGQSSFNSGLLAYGGEGGKTDNNSALCSYGIGLDGGGAGGSGGGVNGSADPPKGGGGGGGYSGSGGNTTSAGASAGSGGGGGGGGNGVQYTSGGFIGGAGGGGVGIYGQGTSGDAGVSAIVGNTVATGGGGGSYTRSGSGDTGSRTSGNSPGAGGRYGGGGGGGWYYQNGPSTGPGAKGAFGAVRIIWGAGRSFPNNAA